MAKTNESVERVEDLKAQVNNFLGLDAMMDESVTKEMKEKLISQAKGKGEEHIEEVLDTIEKALEKIKDPEFKAIIASLIWTKCPLGMQKSCVKLHGEMVDTVMVARMKKRAKGNPLVGLMMLSTMLRDNK